MSSTDKQQETSSRDKPQKILYINTKEGVSSTSKQLKPISKDKQPISSAKDKGKETTTQEKKPEQERQKKATRKPCRG